MAAPIASRRLLNQCLTGAARRTAADVVAWCGAVQAQEYEPAKWGLGLRMRDGTTDAQIERAFEQGEILRTHVMRPTWHFVTPDDIRWLQALTGPRVQRAMATYRRKLELDTSTFVRATTVIERALGDRQFLTRAELSDRLGRARMVLAGIRLAHVMLYAEFEGVICSGPRRGRQFTYALVAERAPHARRMPRDEALAELSRRYFTSHGPATIRDFVWWSGLLTADAKRGAEMIGARREDAGGRTYWSLEAQRPTPARQPLAHLLPIYDEYIVAYRDREAVPHGPGAIGASAARSVTFHHPIVIAGHVAGTWRAGRNPRVPSIDATMLRPVTARERRALAEAAARYARFRGVPAALSIATTAP
jgi:hypothetical protein